MLIWYYELYIMLASLQNIKKNFSTYRYVNIFGQAAMICNTIAIWQTK